MLPTPQIIQLCFTTVAIISLAVDSIPLLSTYLVAYGKSLPTPPAAAPTSSSTSLSTLIPSILHKLTVPHHFFAHFYILGTLANLICLHAILTKSALYEALHSEEGSTSPGSVLLVWTCLFCQVGRRWYEQWYVMKPGKTRMGLLIYFIGWAFYIGVAVGVWIEGCPRLDTFEFSVSSVKRLVFSGPSFKQFVGVGVWAFASGTQHDAHVHLAGLKKYSLPTHPLFASVVCPHYTAEVAIYAGMAVMAAGEGRWVNRTILSVVFFVICGLGESAASQRKWYKEKFGEESMKGKWCILPGLL